MPRAGQARRRTVFTLVICCLCYVVVVRVPQPVPQLCYGRRVCNTVRWGGCTTAVPQWARWCVTRRGTCDGMTDQETAPPSERVDRASYEDADRVSFYSYEVAGMKAALDYIEGLDAALSADNGMCFVSSGEFVISADGSTICTIWWDNHNESWRAQPNRVSEQAGTSG